MLPHRLIFGSRLFRAAAPTIWINPFFQYIQLFSAPP